MSTGFEQSTREQAARLYRERWSVAETASRLGIAYCTVLKWLKAAGVYKTLSPAQLQTATALHDAHTSAKGIARQLAIPLAIVRAALMASGRTPLRVLEARAARRAAMQRTPAPKPRKPATMTPTAEYNVAYDRQGGLCKLCREPEPTKRRLCPDHNGAGQLRALLCHTCSAALRAAASKPCLLSEEMKAYV